MKGIREYYDRTAREWADRWYEDDGMLPCLREFVGRLSDRARILDLGCGAGYESMRLARLGASVTGIDLSPVSVEIAREKNPELTFHVRDMLEDYSDLGLFDGVAAIASLVHLSGEQLRTAFLRMAQAVVPGGMALIVVRDGEGWLERQSHVTVDGEEYDRAFYAHTLDALKRSAEGLFTFSEELFAEPDAVWRNYLFSRQ